MARHFYAVLGDQVYIFEKKSDREKFCRSTLASRIYAYNRIHCREFVNMTENDVDAYLERLKSENRKLTTSSVDSQNSVNRAIKERLRAFDKHVSR